VCYSVCRRLWRVGSVRWRCCEVSEMLEVPEVIRCMLLCMPEAVEGRLCSLEDCEVPR